MEPTPITLQWMDILKLALSTGVVAAMINQGISWIREWTTERKNISREGRYLALRVAVILERFSMDCAELIASSNLHNQTEGNAGKLSMSLPLLMDYPNDADWKSLNPSFCAKALSFRNELELSDKAIAFWFDVDTANVTAAFNQEAGRCGYRAWKTATELRKYYGLPVFHVVEIYWDFVKTLKENHDSAMETSAAAQKTD